MGLKRQTWTTRAAGAAALGFLGADALSGPVDCAIKPFLQGQWGGLIIFAVLFVITIAFAWLFEKAARRAMSIQRE